jgi:hypothetical protein
MLKTFKVDHGENVNFVTIDTSDIAEIHFYNRQSFKLTTKRGEVYRIIEVDNIHGTYEEMYECFLRAIENNERYITDFFLHRDYLGEENQK